MRSTFSGLSAAFVALVATSCLESTGAFSPHWTGVRPISNWAAAVPRPFTGPRSVTALLAEAEEEATAADTEEEEDLAVAEEEEEEEEEESKEDLELKAIKEEIAVLEKTLKAKKSTISYLKDDTEKYSKAGYARKVAEMENMRRARSTQASSNRETSIATVLRSFLSVKDHLDLLRRDYGSLEGCGKTYAALAGNFNSALAELGVTDYAAEVGKPIDRTRVLAVEEEYSDATPKGSVVRPLKLGLELKGNVIRLAECVGSLGVESDAAADAEPAAAEEEVASAESSKVEVAEEGMTDADAEE